jgi:hypothetical protein
MTIYNNGGVSLGTFGNPGINNIAASKFVPGYSAITSAAGTTVLTADSNYYQRLLGSTTQTFQLPDATTLLVGTTFIFDNDSSGVLTVVDNASGPIETIPGGASGFVYLAVNATVAGTWRRHSFLPASYDFNNTTANFGTATITNATWNGNTIGTAYGGTGLTTFSAANYALYSTSSSALVAGTLPVAAGGTGDITFTANGVLYGNGTSPLGVTAAGTTGQVLLANTSGAPTWGSVPTTGAVTSISFGSTGLTPNSATTGAVTVAGTLNATSGGTGISSYAVGDLLFANTTTTLDRIPVGTNGYVLTSNGTAPAWAVLPTIVESFQTSLDGLTPSTATTGAVTLAGTLGTSSGGTNLTSFTSGGALYATSTSALTTGTLPVASGGTGSSTAFTTGSVVFAGASGVYSQDNANFFWDDTNNSLGIGTSSPGGTSTDRQLSIVGSTSAQITTNSGTVITNFGSTSSIGYIQTIGAYPLTFNTNSAERMRIDSAGVVTIGGNTVITTAANATFTGGFRITSYNLGNTSGASLTPDPLLSNYQYATNNGAGTINAPTNDCAIDLLLQNTAGASTITLSGFTVVSGNSGDALTTSATARFIISIRRINSISTYVIKQIQT